MAEPEWTTMHGVLMTSDAVAVCGGVGFAPEVLEQVVESIRSGALPFHVDHDLSKPVRVRNLDAYVRERAVESRIVV